MYLEAKCWKAENIQPVPSAGKNYATGVKRGKTLCNPGKHVTYPVISVSNAANRMQPVSSAGTHITYP